MAELLKHNGCRQCGRRWRDNRQFCDEICRHAYEPGTWGTGRPQDPNKQSLLHLLDDSLLFARLKVSMRRWRQYWKRKRKHKSV